MLPERIPTGIRNSTISNPGHLNYMGKSYNLPVEEFDFQKQTDKYNKIQEILKRSNTKLSEIGAYQYPRSNLFTFVAVSDNDKFVWQKYESGTSGAGQNFVFVAGRKMKTTTFITLPEHTQDLLMDGDQLMLALMGI